MASSHAPIENNSRPATVWI